MIEKVGYFEGLGPRLFITIAVRLYVSQALCNLDLLAVLVRLSDETVPYTHVPVRNLGGGGPQLS